MALSFGPALHKVQPDVQTLNVLFCLLTTKCEVRPLVGFFMRIPVTISVNRPDSLSYRRM